MEFTGWTYPVIDALLLRDLNELFDAWHASPPWQALVKAYLSPEEKEKPRQASHVSPEQWAAVEKLCNTPKLQGQELQDVMRSIRG